MKTQPTVIMVKPHSLKPNKKGNDVLACYNHKKDIIYLDTFLIRRHGYTQEQVMNHELTHRKQWMTHPVFTALNHLLPYDIRPIEKEANKNM